MTGLASGVAMAEEVTPSGGTLDGANGRTVAAPGVAVAAANGTVVAGDELVWDVDVSFTGLGSGVTILLPQNGSETELVPSEEGYEGARTSSFSGSVELAGVEFELEGVSEDAADYLTTVCTNDPNPTIEPQEEGATWSAECGADATAIRVVSLTETPLKDAKITVRAAQTGGVPGDQYVLWVGGYAPGSAPVIAWPSAISLEGAAQSGNDNQPWSAQPRGGMSRAVGDGWITKSPAKVQCATEKSKTCSISWTLTVFNGGGTVSDATFTDTTSTRVDNVEAHIWGHIAQIATGFNHTVALNDDGEVWATGADGDGQQGWGNNKIQGSYGFHAVYVPDGLLGSSEFFIQVAAAWATSYALTSEGRVFGWGRNNYGQLGIGVKDPQGTGTSRNYDMVPVLKAPGQPLDGVVQISSGTDKVLALTASGEVYVWGTSGSGALGLGQGVSERLFATKVQALNGVPVAQISASQNQSFALTADGELYAWGSNTYGALGLDNNYQAAVWTPERVALPKNITDQGGLWQISAGENHTLGLTQNGYVWSWGANGSMVNGVYSGDGRLGRGSATTLQKDYLPGQVAGALPTGGVAQVAAGANFSMALGQNGTGYAWGSNTFRQIAHTELNVYAAPVAMSKFSGVSISELITGSYSRFAFAITPSGTLRSWGYNYYGQLGYSTTNNSNCEIVGGNMDKCYQFPPGTVAGFVVEATPLNFLRKMEPSQVNLDVDGTDFIERVYPSSRPANAALKARAHGLVQIRVTGTVTRDEYDGYVVGNQAYYSSNQEAFPKPGVVDRKPLPAFDPKKPWDFGAWTGNPECAGKDAGDQCDQVRASVPAMKVSATTWVSKSPAGVTCATDDANECDVSWKINVFNGSPTRLNDAVFADVVSSQVRDVEAVLGVEVIGTATGKQHVLALTEDGIHAWGLGGYGQLGDGKSASSLVPVRVDDSMLDPDEVFIGVGAGRTTSFGMTSKGRLFAWGQNDVGQLGTGAAGANRTVPTLVTGLTDVVQISGSGHHTFAVTAAGQVYSWGHNYGDMNAANTGVLGLGLSTNVFRASPQLVTTLAGKGVVQVSAGLNFGLALTASGDLYSWGSHQFGQLGNGTAAQNTSKVLYPTKVNNAGQPRFVQIGAGSASGIALTGDGDVYTWGSVAGNKTKPTLVAGIDNVSQVAASEFFLALKNDGQAYTWGSSNGGRYGQGSGVSVSQVPGKVKQPAGIKFTEVLTADEAGFGIAIGSNGKFYSWGINNSGVLGNGLNSGTVWEPGLVTNIGASECLAAGFYDLQLSEKMQRAPNDNNETGTAFQEWRYGTDQNNELKLCGYQKVSVLVSGKVDRGAQGYTIGNQAYFSSDAASISTPVLKPMLPGYDAAKPWDFGVWGLNQNDTCAGMSSSTQCDQVWASVKGSTNVGVVEGFVKVSHDPNAGTSLGDYDIPVPNVHVELRKDGVAGPELIDETDTGTDGYYSFDVAVGGGYYVTFDEGNLPSMPVANHVWEWVQPDGTNTFGPFSVTKGAPIAIDGLLRPTPIAPGELVVQKGWKDPITGIIAGSLTYSGDLEGRTETITAEVQNNGDDPLSTFQFSDATAEGAKVVWESCSVLDKHGTNVPGATSFAFPAGTTNPVDLPLTGVTVQPTEILACVGTLALKDLTDTAVHTDEVTIAAEDDDGGEWEGSAEFTAKAGDGLLAEKGVLDSGSIKSSSYIQYGAEQPISARITNSTDDDYTQISVADVLVEGPEVVGLTDDCVFTAGTGGIATLPRHSEVVCAGLLTMDGYTHKDTVVVTALDVDGNVHRAFADFEASSSGSLPRAGMIGIWALVIGGAVLVLVAAVARSKKPAHSPRH